MKIKATFRKEIIEELEIDVDFPIYRKHDFLSDRDDTVIYARLTHEQDMFILVSVKETDKRDYEIEIEKFRRFPTNASYDYCLGKGEYESSKSEFEGVARRMLEAVMSQI